MGRCNRWENHFRFCNKDQASVNLHFNRIFNTIRLIIEHLVRTIITELLFALSLCRLDVGLLILIITLWERRSGRADLYHSYAR